nr:hypothetical protein HmN_000724300 [Hymenolepis microstoma]
MVEEEEEEEEASVLRSERPGGRALELYYTDEVRGKGRRENEKKLHEEMYEIACECRCYVAAPTAAGAAASDFDSIFYDRSSLYNGKWHRT